MICLKNVNKKYGKKVIFDKANLMINSPGLYLIKGDNGVGKTTLLNIIGGFEGVNGKVVNDYKNSMSYLFQNSYLIDTLNVKQHLELFNIDINIANKFSLENCLDKYPSCLSNGERQRIAFIVALYSDSLLVLLDEPTSNLDKENSLLVKKEICKFKDKKIILMINHDYKEFINDVDGIIEIRNYKIFLKNKNKRNDLLSNKKTTRIFNFKKLFKGYYKIFLFISLFFLLFTSLSFLSSFFINKVDQDILNSVDYNKFYLKKCNDINNNGFIISNCSNPSEDVLKDLNIEYGYNYDFLLTYLYNREDLSVFNNENIVLKEGRTSLKYNEVVASEHYNIGDIIELESNTLLSYNTIDIYNEKISLTVVGIYKELAFYDDNNIYLDYHLLEAYFKQTTLINNKISLYDYYLNLEIDNYKYLSFEKVDNDSITFQGSKYEFYQGMKEIINKVSILLKYISNFIVAFFVYYFYKINKNYLIKEQKSVCFLLANSFSKSKMILSKICHLITIPSCILCVFLIINFNTYLLIAYFLFVIILLYQIHAFYSRTRIANYMREELW